MHTKSIMHTKSFKKVDNKDSRIKSEGPIYLFLNLNQRILVYTYVILNTYFKLDKQVNRSDVKQNELNFTINTLKNSKSSSVVNSKSQ